MKHTEELAQQTIQLNAEKLLEKIKNNIYIVSDYDRQCIMTVIDLYRHFPRNYTRMLYNKSGKYKDIVQWINEKTNFLKDSLEFTYNLQTRLHWIVNQKTLDNIKCAKDDCDNLCGLNMNLRLNEDFPLHCCEQCNTADSKTIAKSKATKKKRYGNENYVNVEKAKMTIQKQIDENPNYWIDKENKNKQTKISKGLDPNWNNREKALATFNKHKEEDPEFVAKQTAKSKATKKEKHGDENYVNVEKAKATNIERFGVDNPMRLPEFVQRAQQTFRDNHNGLTSTLKLPEVREKIHQTVVKKYGVDNVLKSPIVRQKIIKTWIEKYGVDHPWKAKSIRDKIKQTNIEKYGAEIYVGSKKCQYDGNVFDSTWELAVWIYCKDNNISIVKNPTSFTYLANGKEHEYYVDFMIDGNLVEIKGDQFFKDDGTMYCPYKLDEWTTEQYDEYCQLYAEKQKCMIANNVKILRYSDLTMYLDYVSMVYGKEYLKQFVTK